MKQVFLVPTTTKHRKFDRACLSLLGALRHIVYGALGGGFLIASASAAPPPGWTPPPTELLIIVPYKEPGDEPRQVNEDWITEGRRLRNYKQTSGLGAVLKSLNDINRDYEGRDEPERIKRAIYDYARDPGIKYVMLVGDAKLMPVRYQYQGYTTDGRTFYSNSEDYCRERYCDGAGSDCTSYCAEHPSYCDEERRVRWCPYESYGFVPNDGYYANVWDDDDPTKAFDDWDGDGDGLFGELYRDNYRGVDGNTMHPDVVVGRVPVRSPEEFRTFIGKVMAYEDAADGMRRTDAYRKALLTASDLGARNHYLLGEDLGSRFDITYLTLEGGVFTIQHGDESEDTTATPALFMSEFIDGNSPHFVGYGGHGSQNCWCQMGFGWLDAAALTNELPVIAAAASCSTAKLAEPAWYLAPPAVPVTASDTPAQNMAEAFVGRSDGGAVAYVGAVTTSRGGANHLERRFFRAIKDGARTAGDAWRNALEGYIADYSLDVGTASDWHDDPTHPEGGYFDRTSLGDYNRMHFFGDPSLRRDGAETGDDSPLTTRARYERRVHVDPASRYVRIYFEATDRESDANTTRYRYRTGKSWSAWLSGAEFYLPLPASPKEAQCGEKEGTCEAVVEYYSVDRAGKREPVKAARIVYDYTKGKQTKKSSKETGTESASAPAGFSIKGKVVDEKGRALRAVLTLTNKGRHWKTQTDAEGWYVFSALPPAQYELEVIQIPAGLRQFVPTKAAYSIVLDTSSAEKGFVFARDDVVAPTMTQELPWNTVAKSGCVYGLAYDDWYGAGVGDVEFAVVDARNRWLSAKGAWMDKEAWLTPHYVAPLNEFLERDLDEELSSRLPKGFQKTERTRLEPLACRLGFDCKPLVWIQCFKDPTLLAKGSKIVRGRVKDNAGNIATIETRDVELVADFDASAVEGTAPLTVEFENRSQGTVTDVEWDFGDGTRSVDNHPTHTYNTPGTYTATLSVSGPESWQTATKEVHVTAK